MSLGCSAWLQGESIFPFYFSVVLKMIKQQLLYNIIHLPVLYEQKHNDLIHANSVREKAVEGKTRLFTGGEG